MEPSSPKIQLDLVLVVNHETFGPMYCTDTNPSLFKDPPAQQMFASRIVLTSGIGDKLLTPFKFHGPVEITENTENKYKALFFPIHVNLPGNEELGYGDIRRVVVISLIFLEEWNKKVVENLEFIESQFRSLCKDEKIEEYVTALDPSDLKQCEVTQELLERLKKGLEYAVNLRLEGLRRGISLFDLGVLGQLPEKHKKVGSYLIRKPEGWVRSQFEQEFSSKVEDLEEILEELFLMGFITMENDKIIPK